MAGLAAGRRRAGSRGATSLNGHPRLASADDVGPLAILRKQLSEVSRAGTWMRLRADCMQYSASRSPTDHAPRPFLQTPASFGCPKGFYNS